jgi:hypothetical protein
MVPTCGWALKEWAGVCAGLAHNQSILILRKGGIHEEDGVFKPENPYFWLYPTQFHQTIDQFQPQYHDFMQQAKVTPPDAGHIDFQLFADCESAFEVVSEPQLQALCEFQMLSKEVMTSRYRYRENGLCGMILRCYQRDIPISIRETPDFAGCKSWVELGHEYSTTGCKATMADEEFDTLKHKILAIVNA